MKKILITLFSSLFFVSLASAEIGVNVGVSGNAGGFVATATENENGEKDKAERAGTAGWGSFFIEKTLGERLAVGIEIVPGGLESETEESVVDDKTTSDTSTLKTQKVQVDFDNLRTAYLMVKPTENLFVRAGYMQVDVETNETLATGSKYDDTDLGGVLVGIGYNQTMDNGMFFRVEGNYMEFDSETVTASNTDNKVTLDSLSGASGKISIGKSF